MNRRGFLTVTASGFAPAVFLRNPVVKFGIDLFSIRSQGWTPFEYLDYCARWNAGVVHFSEPRFLGNLEESHLKAVRAHAGKLGIELEIGMRSICPSSKTFDRTEGTAEEQLTRMIRAARVIGSKIVRAVLGSMADRTGLVPIEGHIENTLRVLRAVRAHALDDGIKIAVENHAGDMQARELKMLIEEAGTDFVGACVDSGNALWTLEDPHLTLDVLHPYILTSHVRDSAIWRVPEGVAVKWVRMGEGNIGIPEYVEKFQKLCPGRALSLEIIVTQPRIFKCLDPEFWEGYRGVRAWEFARFLALAEAGHPHEGLPPPPKELAAQREREDLESSIRFTQKLLKV
jgi:sugar phosphate isomerase/epimerase